MKEFDSISHFIQSGDFKYRVFDMGRKVVPIDNQFFEKLEEQKNTYPYPFQKKAWLALVLWEEERQDESTIWFLQFPIDELGFLKQQSRDAFLIDLLEQTGKNIHAKQKGKQVLDELKESPFAFKPAPFRLAAFHALATCELDRSPSQYYQHAHDYLTGEAGYEQWQFLGLQGIADVVARLDQDNNESLLIEAIGQLPATPLETFAQMLENTTINQDLFQALNTRLKQELAITTPHILLVSALLRGISGADPALRKDAISNTLESSLGTEIEVLAAISGRSWESLNDSNLFQEFIEKLSFHEQVVFDAILTDLLMIPGLRKQIFAAIKNPKCSVSLNQRLDIFIRSIKDQSN